MYVSVSPNLFMDLIIKKYYVLFNDIFPFTEVIIWFLLFCLYYLLCHVYRWMTIVSLE